jgi:D-proline reductase (dithiol) PrdB
LPLDRLDEMAVDGEIGSVADVHISFMGAQVDSTLETIRLDTGPAAAQVLKDDQVDVVLLTPV